MASTLGAYGESLRTPQSSQSPAVALETISTQRDRKKKQQQPRQLLSCTKCRERKVKCDRTKPCSACCARGLPKECHFVLGEGTEFGPIQQSLELRKLRLENQRLKERLLAAKVSLSDESDDDDGSSTGKQGQSSRRGAGRQKRFRTGDHTDSLYFGSPGLANVISDFANMQVEPKSLAFTMPRGAEIYAAHNSMYPFPALWQATTATEALLRCLEPHETLLTYIDTFASKAVGFAFPFLPEDLTRKEVEHFLQEAEQNAVMYPDALALIFAGAALGIQLGGEDQDASQREDRLRRGDVFVAAVMQALRASAFMSRPTLRSLHALLIIGPYLTNSSRFLDAWSLFGLTIRLAQSIGLHRNPKYLDPVPQLRECTIRSNTWWWMLHIDQLYSMTLGRPLGISGMGDCQPAELLTTDPAVLRLGEFVDQLTILGRQVLSSNQLTDAKVDMFTDRLISLWDTMPDTLQFNETWSSPDIGLPEYPLCVTAAVHYCKIHSYIILLNRQRVENTRASPEYSSPSPRSFQSTQSGPNSQELPLLRPHSVPRGKPMVIQSSLALLDAFIYFFKRVRVALTDWTIGQQAFNACMILLLDALETGETQAVGKVEQAYAIFVQLDKHRVHQLASLAVSRISEGLLRLRDAIDSGPPWSDFHQSERQNSTAMSESVARKSSVSSSTKRGSDAGIPSSRYYDESVMGSRSMFLLEDPGLQSKSVFTPAGMTGLGGTHQDLPSTQSADPTSVPTLGNRQSPESSKSKAVHSQKMYQPDNKVKQPSSYQHHTELHTQHGLYDYPSQQGTPYAFGFQPRFVPRRDSVTATSSHVVARMVGSTSPQAPAAGPYIPPSMPPSMQPPALPSHFQVPMMHQQSFGAPHQQQQQLQMSEQDWQALRMQQLAQLQAGQQRGQMFPPRQPRSR